MLAKIKLIGAAVGAFVMAMLYALLQKEKAERADEHADIANANQQSTRKATEAILDGQQRQQEIKNEKIDTTDRNILS